MRTDSEQLRYYLEGFRERAAAAIAGTPLRPETELAAADQALGQWEACFGKIPEMPEPMCPGCDED